MKRIIQQQDHIISISFLFPLSLQEHVYSNFVNVVDSESACIITLGNLLALMEVGGLSLPYQCYIIYPCMAYVFLPRAAEDLTSHPRHHSDGWCMAAWTAEVEHRPVAPAH